MHAGNDPVTLGHGGRMLTSRLMVTKPLAAFHRSRAAGVLIPPHTPVNGARSHAAAFTAKLVGAVTPRRSNRRRPSITTQRIRRFVFGLRLTQSLESAIGLAKVILGLTFLGHQIVGHALLLRGQFLPTRRLKSGNV